MIVHFNPFSFSFSIIHFHSHSSTSIHLMRMMMMRRRRIMRSLRDLNGWEMRMSDKVVYCRGGQVEMFSDASDLQMGGARFYGEKVAWDTVFKAALAEEERKRSSTFRELRGIEEGILANKEG